MTRALLRDGGLLLFGAAVTWYFGRIGLMPLDSCIVFDGGWRVLCGQFPFRDFVTPSGIVPMLMQAGCFAVGGVNWATYLAHAAILNGVYAILIHRLLRASGTPSGAAVGFAALASLALFPVKGTPYMEQHAFFFGTLAVTLAVCGARCDAVRRRRLCWIAVGPALLLAYFSKQIPSVFIAPVAVLAAVAFTDRARWRELLACLATGALLALTALAAIAFAAGVELDAYYYYNFTLPREIGNERIASLFDWRVLWTTTRISVGMMGHHGWPTLMLTMAATHVATIVALALVGRDGPLARALRPERATLLLAAGLVWTCVAFTTLTMNHHANGLPYGIVAGGLLYGLFHRWTGRLRAAGVVLARLTVLAAVLDAAVFAVLIDYPRVANAPAGGVEARETGIPALWPLRWQTPGDYPLHDHRTLAELLEHLRTHDGNVFLFGDATILYGLSGRPSAGQSVWLHPGLTMPQPADHDRYHPWEWRLMWQLHEQRVRWVIVEREALFALMRLSDIPSLVAWLDAGHGRAIRGGVQIFEVDPDWILRHPLPRPEGLFGD